MIAFAFAVQARHVGKVVVSRPRSQPDAVAITGGMGTLGRLVAGWLVRQGTKRVRLIGRRGRTSTDAALELYGGAASPGFGAEVTLCSSDISVQVRLGYRVWGIEHGAGVTVCSSDISVQVRLVCGLVPCS